MSDSKKKAKKKYSKPVIKSENIGEGMLKGGPTCNGMTGGGRKASSASGCTTLLS